MEASQWIELPPRVESSINRKPRKVARLVGEPEKAAGSVAAVRKRWPKEVRIVAVTPDFSLEPEVSKRESVSAHALNAEPPPINLEDTKDCGKTPALDSVGPVLGRLNNARPKLATPLKAFNI